MPGGREDTLASLEREYAKEEGVSMRLGDADLPPNDEIFWAAEADAVVCACACFVVYVCVESALKA